MRLARLGESANAVPLNCPQCSTTSAGVTIVVVGMARAVPVFQRMPYNCAMPAPILATKLYMPAPRARVVSRPRLIERLDAGLNGKLTLISAAAGCGKTTLVSAWIAARQASPRPLEEGPGVRAAWLSLDEGDNDPARFLAPIGFVMTRKMLLGIKQRAEDSRLVVQS